MKKIFISVKMLFVIGALTLGLNACQKETITPGIPNGNSVNPTTQITQHDVEGPKSITYADQSTDDISRIVNEVFSANNLAGYAPMTNNPDARLSSCAKVTVNTETSPQSITIDFGAVNCLGQDGHYRRGKIIATFTGPYREKGTMITLNTFDFYLDNNQVDAHMSWTNLGREGERYNRITFAQETNATITFNNISTTSLAPPVKSSIRYTAHYQQLWVDGEGTENVLDDIYFLNGYAESTTSAGVVYRAETLKDIRKDVAWRYNVWGVEEITRTAPNESNWKVQIDYAYPSGGYDDLALLTYPDGTTEVIHLK